MTAAVCADGCVLAFATIVLCRTCVTGPTTSATVSSELVAGVLQPTQPASPRATSWVSCWTPTRGRLSSCATASSRGVHVASEAACTPLCPLTASRTRSHCWVRMRAWLAVDAWCVKGAGCRMPGACSFPPAASAHRGHTFNMCCQPKHNKDHNRLQCVHSTALVTMLLSSCRLLHVAAEPHATDLGRHGVGHSRPQP